MRKKLLALINDEIRFAKKKQTAWIVVKLNSLVDRDMINALYKASQAGVLIKLIVRGACSLWPEMEDLSENITATSIIDKYLEHSRIFIFNHGGEERTYISSADWMHRNLDRRIECACPVYDEKIKKELKDFISIQLADNVKARVLDRKLLNRYREDENDAPVVRAQEMIYDYYLKKGKLPVYGKTGVPLIKWPDVIVSKPVVKKTRKKKKKNKKKIKK
jgi:polyphosphate kinase